MYEYENVRDFFFGITPPPPPIADFEKRFFQVHEGRRHLLTSALDALSLTILENLEIYSKKSSFFFFLDRHSRYSIKHMKSAAAEALWCNSMAR